MDIGRTTGNVGSRSEQVEKGIKGRNVNGAAKPTVAQRVAVNGRGVRSLRQPLTTSVMAKAQSVSHDHKLKPRSDGMQNVHVDLDDFKDHQFSLFLDSLKESRWKNSKNITAISLTTKHSGRLKRALDVLAEMKHLKKLTFRDMNFCGILDSRLLKFLIDNCEQNDGGNFNELAFENCKFPNCKGGQKDFYGIGLALSLAMSSERGIHHFSVKNSNLSPVNIAELADVLNATIAPIKTVRLEKCVIDDKSRGLLSELREFKCEDIDGSLTLRRQKLNRGPLDSLVVCGERIGDTRISTELNNLARIYAQSDKTGDLVKAIIFKDCQIDDDAEIENIADAIRKIGGAYYLSFEGCQLNDKNINALCHLISSKRTTVCALSLSEANLSADALMKIAKAYRRGCDKNHYLDISGNNLSREPKVLEAILSRLGPLKAIEMSNCALDREDAAQVRRVIKMNDKIEYIGMSDNNIDDAGAIILGRMVNETPTLKKVVLNDNFIGTIGLGYLRRVNEAGQLSELNRIEFNGNDDQFDASMDAAGVQEIKVVSGYLKRLKESGISKIDFKTSESDVSSCLRKKEVNDFVRSFQRAFNSEVSAVQAFNTGLLASERHHTNSADMLYQLAEVVPVGGAVLGWVADAGTMWFENKIIKENEILGRMMANPLPLYKAVEQVAKILGVFYSQRFDDARAEADMLARQLKRPAQGFRAKIFKGFTKAKEAIGSGDSKSFSEDMAEKKAAVLLGYCKLGFIKSDDFLKNSNEVDVFTEKFTGILLDCYSPEEISEMIGGNNFGAEFKAKLEKIKNKKLDGLKRRLWRR